MRFSDNGGIITLDHDNEPDLRLPALVTAMISHAASSGKPVQTKFNPITMVVAGDSDPRLIRRDYYAMFFGHLPRGVVGPYPPQDLGLTNLDGYTLDQLAQARTWNLIHPSQR